MFVATQNANGCVNEIGELADPCRIPSGQVYFQSVGLKVTMTVLDDSTPLPRSCRQVEVNGDGIAFISCDDSKYMSLNVHRSKTATKHEKSIWDESLSRGDECHTFCEASLRKWHDTDGNCWSVVKEGETAFGTRGERVAFFWLPQNDGDPWHGFPVTRTGKMPFRKEPPDDLVERWHKVDRISFTMYLRLLKGRW